MRNFGVRHSINGYFIVPRIAFCLLLISSLVPGFCAARVIHVPSEYPNIQTAVAYSSNGDTILVADGIYFGENNRGITIGGKKLVIRSENGPFRCVIDCQDQDRGFIFDHYEIADTIIEGFTVKNGSADLGGAIYCYAASPTLINCRFLDNTATVSGGAIHAVSLASPILINCLIINNSAPVGAGVFCDFYSEPEIQNCTIADNSAANGGGGIFCAEHSKPSIRDSILWANVPNAIEVNTVTLPSIEFCDIEGGAEGQGNINADPLFSDAGFHDGYYLSQIESGQIEDSPCVDAGSDYAATICFHYDYYEICFDGLTTRSDETVDSMMIDMGFHYFPENFIPPTPTPTNTATPTGTPTPTPTKTMPPFPTDLPSETPMPTETATPTPIFSVRLEMPGHYFSYGDKFSLNLEFNNYDRVCYDVELYCVLNYQNYYWFFPDWSEDMDSQTISLALGSSATVPLDFTWPDTGHDAVDGLVFWAAVYDPAGGSILGGEIDGVASWEFGFGPAEE